MSVAQTPTPASPTHPGNATVRPAALADVAGIRPDVDRRAIALAAAARAGPRGRLARAAPGPDRRRAARTNIALCFPELDAPQRETLLREHFRDLGIGLFEFARAWWGSVAPMRRTVRIEGLEQLQALQAQKRGVLMVSGHFMTLELCGRLMCDHIPLPACTGACAVRCWNGR